MHRLQGIINKSLPTSLSHITAKGLINLKLTENPAYKEKSKSTANQVPERFLSCEILLLRTELWPPLEIPASGPVVASLTPSCLHAF